MNMFEADEASPFVGGPTQPPIIKRSISAPAIADHENYGDADGLFYNANAPSRLNPRIPKMRANIHGDEGSEDANLESYDTDKYLATEPGDNDEGAAVEDDNSSLWIDPRKTPMDRIQEDFPLTPSAVYSKRLLANAEGRFDQDIGDDEDNHGEDPLLAAATSAHHQQQSPSPRSSSFLTQSGPQPNSPTRHNVGRTNGDDASKSQTGGSGSNGSSSKFTHTSDAAMVDHVAMSLSSLYVSDDDMVNGGMRAARSSSNLLSTPNGSSGSIAAPASVANMIQITPPVQSLLQPLSLQQVPVRAGSPRGMAVPAPMQTLSANSQSYTGALPTLHQIGGMGHILEQQQLHQHATPQGQGQGVQGQGLPHQSLYRPQQHQQQQQLMGMTQVQQQQQQQMMQQQGVQYLTMAQGTEGGAPSLAGPNGQQPAYYVQQPVYLDQNGQPVYYRVANQSGQYQQQDGQMIYGVPNQQEGVNPLGDPLQVSYIPYNPAQGQAMGNQSGYWAHQGQDAQGQPVYMTAGPGGMAVQGQAVDANGMVRRVAYGNIQSQQQYVMANGGQVAAGTHRGQGQQVGMVPGQGQYMNGMMAPQGSLSANGMMTGQMAQMGGRVGTDLDNGMFQVNPRGDQGMGGRPVDIRDRVDVRNGKQQDVGGNNNLRNQNNDNNNNSNNRNDRDRGGGGDREFRRDDRRDDRLRDDRREDRSSDRRDRDRDRDRDGRDKRDREREWGDRDRGGYSRNNNSNNNSSAGVNPVRDALVDEFRSTYGKSRQWGLCDLLGHVVAFCQDQHGSRFIQQRLEVCSDVDKQLIFDEIIPSAHLLMTDVFGNYVLQKLFEYGTPEQCEALALLLSGQSVQLAMQMYGCRVVQKALEYVSTQRLIALVSEFENPPVLLRCVHDSNGNHVIQKCIEIVSRVAKEASTPELSEFLSSRIQFIIDAFQGRVKELSSHPYGCRVVQRILEHCSNPQKSVILEELRQCCAELVQDCYGNYVIQFVMQHGWEADRAVLIREVQTNLLDFSQHKFASNVVEKCLQYASKRDRDEMIWTIINVTFDLKNPVDAKTGHCVLESMVRDPYANYVVQKVIDVSDERQRGAIMRYVKENIVQLRRYTYGKHIIVRLEKITNEKF